MSTLTELKEIKALLSKLLGSSNLPVEEQFSQATLNKAEKEFKKLSVMRGEWVAEDDLHKILKNGKYNMGKFIQTEFGFSNYFKQGRTVYYNREDIVKLADELKVRNVNLGRYMELKQDKENFRKKLAEAASNKKTSKLKNSYFIEDDVREIDTSEPPKPSADLVRDDLKNLEEEFFKFALKDYVDIYRGRYAMIKFEYRFSKYINNEIRLRSKRWCENFNYANTALEGLTGKKSSFIPLKDDELIQL